MKKLKISMLGAGSGFVLSVAKELVENKEFGGCSFVVMDIAEDRLKAAEEAVAEIFSDSGTRIELSSTLSRAEALEGADYVISSCEINRYENWVNDLRIPARFGAHQVKGENGGPGGMIHAIRNIAMFQDILSDMTKLCPGALLLNFTNPMSILCTYFKNYSPVRTLGFCHQVHGSFGVIAEMLGFAPGRLEVVSAGINHLNWLFDIRLKGSGESFLEEFLMKVRRSKFWREKLDGVPPQKFTLEILNTFNMYPIGYDDHIIEYLPFFWEPEEWEEHGFESLADSYDNLAGNKEHTLETQRLLGKEYKKPPFPEDPDHPYYAEKPCRVIKALETNEPLYIDSIVIKNNGAIGNLPAEAIVDAPAIAVGGGVRSVHVGELPIGPMEICRRQITLHEMIARAAHEGDDSLAVQALCLDPYVRSISQARNIWDAFRKEYRDYLPKAFKS